MKIFVCEFITAGGLYRDNLPPRLAKEACLMRDALLSDLADLNALNNQPIEIMQTYDQRLLPPILGYASPITLHDDVWQVWDTCIESADAVWLVAPESDGILLKLAQRVEALGKPLIGAKPQAIALTSNKYQTYQALTQAGMLTVDTYLFSDLPNMHVSETGYVVKRMDGVSCEDSFYFKTYNEMLVCMQQSRQQTHIVQPYIEGIPASMSCVFYKDSLGKTSAKILSINQQHISIDAGEFSYSGSTLNVMPELEREMQFIAQQVASAIDGLLGYVGLDVIVSSKGVMLLEINPRLTTSYVGLRQGLGINPVALILDMLMQGQSQLWSSINRVTQQVYV